MKKIVLLIAISCCLFSCETYYTSVSSLKDQFAGIDSSKMKMVDVYHIGVLLPNMTYLANPIKLIYCKDENGNPAILINSPSIETRFTYGKDAKRTVFYFDRLVIANGKVYGVESRLMPFIRYSIPIDSITKIEIQDDGKHLKYITPPWPQESSRDIH